MSVLNLIEPGSQSDGLSAVLPFGGTKNEVAVNVDIPIMSGDPSSFSFDKFLILICDIINLRDRLIIQQHDQHHKTNHQK